MTRTPPRLISVVLPVRNGAATIAAQLEALAAQDYSATYELIVVDDRSTDATREIVRRHAARFAALHIVDTAAPPRTRNGSAAARNRGAAAACGDLLAFCDADDVVASGWLTALAAAAPGGELIAGALDTDRLNPEPIRKWQRAPSWQRRSQGLEPRFTTASCAVWVRPFNALDGFDESHPGAEDEDLARRARRAGYRLQAAPEAVVAYRYRTSLRATARQRFRWGTSEARLYRDFAASGLRRTPPADTLRAWAWTLANLPLLPFSAARRGRWTVRTAQQTGRLIGSARERVVFL